MIKKAEDYLLEFVGRSYSNIAYNSEEVDIMEAIKAAQLDAIDEAVKLCADTTNLIINSLSSTDKDFDDDYQCGDTVISVNRRSILNCAEILKKEL